MGAIGQPSRAKLFLAVMYADDASRDRALEPLGERFGAIDLDYGPVPFDFTDYYRGEMGPGLRKWYCTFEGGIGREQLSEIKVLSNEIEERMVTSDGNRTVNLDPGYLTNDKLVLASTKDFFHRIYLARGIYAEVTLHFRKGAYRHFSWTYPDYKQPDFLRFLEKARAKHVGESRRGTNRA